jgi:AcrR family transcriptional regulator
MSVMTRTPTDIVKRKSGYHHGNLRDALVGAARQLLSERGVDGFSLSDACRQAGVSTAAPYKHFRDKNEILEEITVQGFNDLGARLVAAVDQAGPGTIPGMVAMGHAYVSFAIDETAVFRLMFGQHPALKQIEHVSSTGRGCFGQVIEQVELYCLRNGVCGDPRAIALELWTFVHGAASLLIDEDYQKVAPGIDVQAMITSVTPRLLRLQVEAK